MNELRKLSFVSNTFLLKDPITEVLLPISLIRRAHRRVLIDGRAQLHIVL
ncbi:hypothetical protein HanRHA438_Chr16g0765641 [Helianthus annuus]|nr:hypothetical protein HanRHA438_Chr16g0765641 [Helianthus annuus]